jgi:hypothetical protein
LSPIPVSRCRTTDFGRSVAVSRRSRNRGIGGQGHRGPAGDPDRHGHQAAHRGCCGGNPTEFTASDVGWVVGHSYTVYGPLLAGATTVLYEGDPVGTPDAGQFWRAPPECGVKSMLARRVTTCTATSPSGLATSRRMTEPTASVLHRAWW